MWSLGALPDGKLIDTLLLGMPLYYYLMVYSLITYIRCFYYSSCYVENYIIPINIITLYK